MYRYQIMRGGVWDSVTERQWNKHKGRKRVLAPNGSVVVGG